MALEIEQKQGGVLESPSFPGLPHRTNGEREDPKEVGEGFVSTMPQILLLRNPSRVLTPVKTVVKIILESGLQLLFRVSGISLDVFVERGWKGIGKNASRSTISRSSVMRARSIQRCRYFCTSNTKWTLLHVYATSVLLQPWKRSCYKDQGKNLPVPSKFRYATPRQFSRGMFSSTISDTFHRFGGIV